MLHVATVFSLKQGETRTSHGPIPNHISVDSDEVAIRELVPPGY